jgi:hypothetical protein
MLIATGITVSGISGIGQPVDVGLPAYSVNDIDVSHQQSSGFRKFVPSQLVTAGELSITNQFTGTYPAIGVLASGIAIHIPSSNGYSGCTLTFAGYVKSFSPAKANLDGVITTDITIKVDGGITIT